MSTPLERRWQTWRVLAILLGRRYDELTEATKAATTAMKDFKRAWDALEKDTHAGI